MYASINTLKPTQGKPISKLVQPSNGLDHQDGTGKSIAHWYDINRRVLKSCVKNRLHHQQGPPYPVSSLQLAVSMPSKGAPLGFKRRYSFTTDRPTAVDSHTKGRDAQIRGGNINYEEDLHMV